MRDFTIEVGNLPCDHLYGGKQLQLQALLWIHFERHVKEAMEASAKQNENQERLDQINQERLYEIMDINFGYRKNVHVNTLMKMDTFDRERHVVMHEMREMAKNGKEIPANLEEKVIELYRKYNECKRVYTEMQNEQLYEKWEINFRRNRKETTQSIMVAYITFKSMLGK